uniref:Zmp:0000000711 n=1 Tax=Cyprinus carpio TaxID=7962 RepID=A0A8C2GZB2_CYPCA
QHPRFIFRALLEQKQRRKRQEPLMVQPNSEGRPRRSRPRRSEEQAPLVETHLSTASDIILDGIDGPAALLGSEAPDLGSKIQVLSVSPPQQSSPPAAEEPETDADTDTLLEPKPDIHTLLQRRGLSGSMNYDEASEDDDGDEAEERNRSLSPNTESTRPASASSTKSTTECLPLGSPSAEGSSIEVDNLEEFVLRPAPRGVTVKCRISRDKKGMDRGLYPTYFMHLEREDGKKVFLLAGRKRKKSKTSNYLISVDATDLSREGESFIGKLRCLSRVFCLVLTHLDSGNDRIVFNTVNLRSVGCFWFSTRFVTSSHIYNANPNYFNLLTVTYILSFHFIKIRFSDYIVMQFGRVAEDIFTLDFNYPMCALQAFAIGLSSFDSKLACE